MSSAVADVASALGNQGYSRGQAKAMARRASSSTGSNDFDVLLRTALKGRNPLAKKRKKRKKKMPAGLAAYWRKMRAKKNPKRKKRKTARRRKTNPKRRTRVVYRTKVTIKYRSRPKKKRKVRRRKSNPLARVNSIRLPAMSPSATKRVIGIIRRVSRRRVRVQ